MQVLKLYQLLAPNLVGRALVFGNNLALSDDVVELNAPYFKAPGDDGLFVVDYTSWYSCNQ